MQIKTDEGTPRDLSAVEVLLSAGCPLRVIVAPNAAQRVPGPFVPHTLIANQNELASGLEVIACLSNLAEVNDHLAKNSSTAWIMRQVSTFDNGIHPEDGLILFQRGADESMADLLKRWIEPGEIAPADGQVIVPDELERFLTPGSVLMQPGGGDVAYRYSLVDVLCASRCSGIAGLYEPLGHSGWSFFGHTPGSTDINMVCQLDPKAWSVGAGLSDWSVACRGDRRIRREFALDADQRAAWMQNLKSGAIGRLGGHEDNIPFRPMTVRWGAQGPYLFSHTLRVTFSLVEQDKANTWIDVVLGTSRPGSRWATASPGSRLLLATFTHWDEKQPYLAWVESGSQVPLNTRFPSWRLAKVGTTDSLCVAVLSTGYVRSEYSAFYAEMHKGDDVIVEVRDGEVPLLLGSLQQFRNLAGQQLRISGPSVSLFAVDAEGKECGTFASVDNEGRLKLEARKDISAMQTVVLSKAKLDITTTTTIDGELKIT